MILGIDEVGRGAWAGPLVVGAVVLGGSEIKGLDDSKKLSKKRREALNSEISEKALGIGLGWVSAEEIDRLGLAQSLRLATIRAVEQIKTSYHEIIIDGTVNFLSDTNKGQYVTTIAKADGLIPSVSAGSIVAKVARDNYMSDLSSKYPDYGFSNHVGYGVKAHRQALEQYGPTIEHRLSFAPLRQQIGYETAEIIQAPTDQVNTTTRKIGNASESTAVSYLEGQGHQIIDRNWRTKFCEIDIVSLKSGTMYFVEVKHRKSGKYGDGYEAITKHKKQQMEFASRLYTHSHKIEATFDQRLAVIATSGDNPRVDGYLEID